MTTTLLIRSLGSEVRRRRKALNNSLDDLSRASKVSKFTLSRLENGKQNVCLDVLNRVSLALYSTPEEMLRTANGSLTP